MNNEIQVTVDGWVARPPQLYGKDEARWVIFRIGSTAWWRNPQGDIREAPTSWFDVKVTQGDMIDNVLLSLRARDPVMVTGRLSTHYWKDKTGHERSGMQIAARSVGHNLRWGKSLFARHSQAGGQNAAADEGAEAGRANAWEARGDNGAAAEAGSPPPPVDDAARAAAILGDGLGDGLDETLEGVLGHEPEVTPDELAPGPGPEADDSPLVDSDLAAAAFDAVDALAEKVASGG
jgi:single-strand DNA-binding protein